MRHLHFLLAVLMATAARGAEIKTWGGTATTGFLNQAPSALTIYRSGSSNLVTISWLTVANPISGSITGASGSSPASALTGTTLAAGVVSSSLTSVGTLANLTVTAPISGNLSGNATTATALQTGRNINGVFFNGTANITVPVAGADITGVVAIANGGTGQDTAVEAIDALSVKGADIASATTTDLSLATGDFVDVTGTTTITGLGTAAAGVERTVRFTGILTLTHNAVSLILPGSQNVTTVGGDRAIFRSLGSGNWLCIDFFPSVVTGTGSTVLSVNPVFTSGITAGFETITGVGGAGFIQYPSQSSAPSAPAGGFREYADASGRFSWIRSSDGFTRTFDATLTANRIYTLPDASITFARTDAAQTFTGDQTFTGRFIESTAGALSAPAFTLTGAPVTGGTATTTKPLALIETTGTTSTAWSTAGTMFGVNAPSGFTGRIADVQITGVSVWSVSATGAMTATSETLLGSFAMTSNGGIITMGASNDLIFGRAAAANVRQGAADAASPTIQTSSVQSVVAGTSNAAGVERRYAASVGTGTGVGGSHVFQVAPAGSTGTAQNALVTAVTIASTLNTTFAGPVIMKGYTVATLPTPAVQGMFVFVTDALTPAFGVTVAGGGAVVTPVFYDGTNWTSR